MPATLTLHAIGTCLSLDSDYLKDARFAFIDDSAEVQHVCHYLPGRPDASGLLVDARNGDYCEVWLTSYRKPWHVQSVYERVL